MRTHGMRVCLAAAAIVFAAQAAQAQPPAIVNARLTTRAAGGALEPALSAAIAASIEATWFGWFAPSAEGRDACCWNGSGNGTMACGCRLEGDRGAVTFPRQDRADGAGSPGNPVPLEGSRRLAVLIRVEDRTVQRIAAFSAACELDAGGRPVVWLDGVKPADSVAYLAKAAVDLAGGSGRSRGRSDGALLALSMHDDPSATPALLSLARSAASPGVRGQALFWLAQKAGAKVAGAIVSAIQDDPDTDVKKRAVFALSQLPKDEGVPLLINLARTNKNVEVRRQAMFWLGQSKDPRALTFFEEVLTR